MKCTKCGQENDVNAKYCSFCGTKLVSEDKDSMESVLSDLDNIVSQKKSNDNYDIDFNNIKPVSDNELINDLNKAEAVLIEAYKYFVEADKIQRTVNLDKFEFNKKLLFDFLKTIAVRVILLVVITLFLVMGRFFIFGLLLFNFGIPIYCIYELYMYYKKNKLDHDNKVIASKNKIKQLNDKGKEILNKNINIIKVVPDNYWMPEAVKNIKNSLLYGRADNLNEALNICDNYLIKVSNDQIRNQLQDSEIEMSKQMRMIQALQISSMINNTINTASINSHLSSIDMKLW